MKDFIKEKKGAEEIDLTPEDNRILDEIRADGELGYAAGIDVFAKMPFRLIKLYGRQQAIHLLTIKANRTPRDGPTPERVTFSEPQK